MKARQVVRECLFSLTELLPMARIGTRSEDKGINTLAAAKSATDQLRRLEHLPWQAILEVSTAHVSAEEIEFLLEGAAPLPFTRCMDNGTTSWLFHVPTPLIGANEVTPLGAGLARIYAFALENGFEYVRIDTDAVTIPQLPILQVQEIIPDDPVEESRAESRETETDSVHD